MTIKYILKLLVVIFFILYLIAYLIFFNLNLNNFDFITKPIIIEGLDTYLLNSFGTESFCKSHKGFDLEKSCNKLTKFNCGQASCCIYTNDNKCKANNNGALLFNN